MKIADGKKMKGGVVVHVRVNPEDLMGCVDLVRQGHADIPGMSPAMYVRLALSGLLEAARKSGAIPEREGWEYSTMMEQTFGTAPHGRKVAVAAVVEAAEAQRAAADLPRSPVKVTKYGPTGDSMKAPILDDEVVRKRARWLVRINELKFKQKADPENFSLAEQEELFTLEREYEETDAA